MSLKNRSPLRYPGGKTRACKILDQVMNDHFDITEFRHLVSPFIGGGSFEFYIQNKYGLSISANDKFIPLYNFWSSCKTNKDDLCRALYTQLDCIDRETFKDYRDRIMDTQDQLEQATMYFIINRCSFSGATLSGGFSPEASKKRFTKSSIDRTWKLNLDKFNIDGLDFAEFIEKSDTKDSLMFLDPPYYLGNGSKLYGKNGDMHEKFDHENLRACLAGKKNWFMTYNDCAYIRGLYKDYKIIEVGWSYGMNKSKASSEIVIVSRTNM